MIFCFYNLVKVTFLFITELYSDTVNSHLCHLMAVEEAYSPSETFITPNTSACRTKLEYNLPKNIYEYKYNGNY